MRNIGVSNFDVPQLEERAHPDPHPHPSPPDPGPNPDPNANPNPCPKPKPNLSPNPKQVEELPSQSLARTPLCRGE